MKVLVVCTLMLHQLHIAEPIGRHQWQQQPRDRFQFERPMERVDEIPRPLDRSRLKEDNAMLLLDRPTPEQRKQIVTDYQELESPERIHVQTRVRLQNRSNDDAHCCLRLFAVLLFLRVPVRNDRPRRRSLSEILARVALQAENVPKQISFLQNATLHGVRAEVPRNRHTGQGRRENTGNAVARISPTQVAAETDDDFGRLCVSLTPYTSTEPANPFAPND